MYFGDSTRNERRKRASESFFFFELEHEKQQSYKKSYNVI